MDSPEWMNVGVLLWDVHTGFIRVSVCDEGCSEKAKVKLKVNGGQAIILISPFTQLSPGARTK